MRPRWGWAERARSGRGEARQQSRGSPDGPQTPRGRSQGGAHLSQWPQGLRVGVAASGSLARGLVPAALCGGEALLSLSGGQACEVATGVQWACVGPLLP